MRIGQILIILYAVTLCFVLIQTGVVQIEFDGTENEYITEVTGEASELPVTPIQPVKPSDIPTTPQYPTPQYSITQYQASTF